MSLLDPISPYITSPIRSQPSVSIVEQPCRSLRYRYQVEGRPGTIFGSSSTPTNRVPFAIQIRGYSGRVVVVVSCVSKEQPYKPHPHNLVGQYCRDGVYSTERRISEDNPIVTFSKIALQCVKRNAVLEALKVREMNKIDPFRTGFSHRNDFKNIDLNVVRLCFQVILIDENKRKSGMLNPIISDPIYNKKLIPDPVIHRLSHCNSYVNGRDEDIILLCAKILKEDVEIRFFEKKNDRIVWESTGTFHPNHIYNNTSICFRPPPYRDQNITEPVGVFVQLVRPSDGETSQPHRFEYLPVLTIPGALQDRRKNSPEKNPLFSEFLQMCSKKSEPIFIPSDSKNRILEDPHKYEPDYRSAKLPRMEVSDFLLDPIFSPKIENYTHRTPIFVQLLETKTKEEMDPEPKYPLIEVPMLDESPLLDLVSWTFPHLPQTINDIDQIVPSASRRNTEEEIPNWNIAPDDFINGTDVNLDSASGIRQVLNMDCNQIILENIHISSGDLEMAEVARLSGSLQDSLVI